MNILLPCLGATSIRLKSVSQGDSPCVWDPDIPEGMTGLKFSRITRFETFEMYSSACLRQDLFDDSSSCSHAPAI